MSEHLFTCEGCGKKIMDGDRYHSGSEVDLCEGCAPSYADMVNNPELFLNGDDDPMTVAQANAVYSEHIASGGKPEDKMVSS